MSRLQSELRRLFVCTDSSSDLIDAEGHTRAAVLGLAAPADWSRLAAVWQGVQAELGWPAPAIAAGGDEGLQLWFALPQPMPLLQAAALMEMLRQRYLADLQQRQVIVRPNAQGQHAALPPQRLSDGSSGDERWAAFVAPDLAPLFAETPSLDIPPGDEGQAHLLSQCHPIPPAALAAALADLQAPDRLQKNPSDDAAPNNHPAAQPSSGSPRPATPREFLLSVMNDAQAPLALRVEAAKALLPGWPTA